MAAASSPPGPDAFGNEGAGMRVLLTGGTEGLSRTVAFYRTGALA